MYFFGVLKTNKQKLLLLSINSAQITLNDRFQLRNNIEMSQTLILPNVLHLVAYGITQALYLTVSIKTDLSIDDQIIMILFGNAVQTIYIFMLPISMIITNSRLRHCWCWCDRPNTHRMHGSVDIRHNGRKSVCYGVDKYLV